VRPNLGERTAGWIYDHWVVSLLLLLAMTVGAGAMALRVGVDNSVEIWFLEDDPALLAWRDFQDTFGNDEVVAVVFHDPEGILDAEGYATLREAVRRAEEVEGVAAADALVTVRALTLGASGPQLAPLIPEAVDDFAQLRARILADPLYVDQLVSRDGTSATVLVRMAAMEDIDARRDAVLEDLREALAPLRPEPWYAGVGVVYAALNQMSTEDSAVFILASYLVIVVLLAWLYRRFWAMVATVTVVGAGALWLVGVMGLAGRDINMVTMVLPTLVMIIGISDIAHLLSHAARDQRPGESRRDRVVRTVGFIFWPCLFNTFTSTLGFLALLTAPMSVVRDLGVFAAVGILAAFVAAIVGGTVALRWEAVEPRPAPGAKLDRLVEGLAELGIRRPKAVLAGTALLALASVGGMFLLEVDTYSIGFLYSDHEVRQHSDAIEAKLGPYTPFELVVVADDVRDPELLLAVERWQERVVAEVPEIGWSRSLVDELGALARAQGQEQLDAAGLARALALYEAGGAQGVEHWVSGEDRLRVTFGMGMQSARGMAATRDAILARAELPAGARPVPSGYLPLYVKMMDYIVLSQLNSFSGAFLVVFALFAVLFRSLRLAALAIPSNLVPVLFTLGAMGALGVHLDVATVTIASIILGLVVDDTVQFLYRLRDELERHGDHERAVRNTVHSLGRSMMISTIGLALGFSVVGLARVKSVAWFGGLCAGTLIFAQFMELLVMPALVMATKPRIGRAAAPPEGDDAGPVGA
jgi:predicted RND superfamily exporter protein